MSNKTIKGINLENIIKLDKIEKGLYNILLNDGTKEKLSLDRSEANSIHYHLRSKPQDVVIDENTSEKTSPNEKRLPSLSELSQFHADPLTVLLKDDRLSAYWPTINLVQKYLSMGYWFAKKEDLSNPEQFNYMRPGQGLATGAACEFQGHVLMITTKENRDRLIKDINRYSNDRIKLAEQMGSNLPGTLRVV